MEYYVDRYLANIERERKNRKSNSELIDEKMKLVNKLGENSLTDEEQIDQLYEIIDFFKSPNFCGEETDFYIEELYQRIIGIKDKIIGEIIEESQFPDRDD